MRFHYVAYQADGKLVEGNADGKDPTEILAFLAKKGLRPVKIKKQGAALGGKKLFQKRSISVDDKVFLTKYLSLMLRVGTDLFKAIDILISDFDKDSIKALMVEIRGSLEKGQGFYTTFAKYPKYFSPVFVNLVKAGESSGTLDKVLGDLNVRLEKERDLRGRLRAAFIYPVILIIMAGGILTFLMTFALPRIAEVFTGGGFNPPAFSRIVFTIGLGIGKFIWPIIGLTIFTSIALIIFFRTRGGAIALRRILSKTPLIGTVIKKVALQRFSATLSALLKSGLPINEALEITASTVGQADMSASLTRISREGISKGLTLGDSFKREKIFPGVVSNLIAISEKAGHLDEILQTLSEFYDAEIDSSVKTLVAFIEPALLIVIGGVVGVIALSIIVPIYQLVGQF